jgi:hypothetical protein
VFADVLFALPSAEIGIEQSSSVKVQHIIFRQAVQNWIGSYQIGMTQMTEAEILDRKIVTRFASRSRLRGPDLT